MPDRDEGEKTMEPVVRTKNVGRAEAILRLLIGIIIIVFAISIVGILRWVAGFIGVAFVFTALFRY